MKHLENDRHVYKMNINLNEESYDYNGLLELFSLTHNFNANELRQAKRKVLKLHPDKCKLDLKYYLFFRKMYYKLEEIYNFTSHAESTHELEKNIDIQSHFKDYLERKKINPKTNFKAFSREFNKMFENVYVSEESEEGHGEWLKSDENMYDKDNLENSRKKAIGQIVVSNNDLECCGEIGKKSLYTYEVKESLGTPFMNMDVEDVYNRKPKFSTVQEYQIHIKSQDITPLCKQQSEDYLSNKEALLNQQSKELAYQHMKHKEENDNRYNNYIKTYLRIE